MGVLPSLHTLRDQECTVKALRFCEEQGVAMRNSYSIGMVQRLSNGYNVAIHKIRNALMGILGCEEYVMGLNLDKK